MGMEDIARPVRSDTGGHSHLKVGATLNQDWLSPTFSMGVRVKDSMVDERES